MTYKINGTILSLQPTTGRWIDRDSIGADGNGHAVYSGKREFELRWGLMRTDEFNEIQGLYNAIGNTGSAVVELPQYAGSTWNFREYSGTVLREPEAGEFFEMTVTDVRLLIVKINT
jgi:hypothetical protein